MSKSTCLRHCGVAILAAGHGKRMKSVLPKVLHSVAGKPILYHILKQVHAVMPKAPIAVVVGVGRAEIQSYIKEEPEFKNIEIQFIIQQEQNGTGHAMQCVMLSIWGKTRVQRGESILVLPGDSPLLSKSLIQQMVVPLQRGEVLRLLVCHLSEPQGYGRIIRKKNAGPIHKIVEEKDATPTEKQIQEVAVSIYLFDGKFLTTALQAVKNQNRQGEYYLTDVVAIAVQQKKKTASLCWKTTEDLQGVNDLWELSMAHAVMNRRVIRDWAQKGVWFEDPGSTRVDLSVTLSEGVTIAAGVSILGHTSIGQGVAIGTRVSLKDVIVESGAVLKIGTVAEKSRIGRSAQVGPYAHLRPETVIGEKTKIGNFVELKKANIGDETSIAHLSYVGDAVVGKRVNIGCGFVTCNFDGRLINGERKHRTIIEDDVFLGSDCQAIAPVRLGKGSYIASGSTITLDVPANALAIARGRQVNKLNYAKKLKKKSGDQACVES